MNNSLKNTVLVSLLGVAGLAAVFFGIHAASRGKARAEAAAASTQSTASTAWPSAAPSTTPSNPAGPMHTAKPLSTQTTARIKELEQAIASKPADTAARAELVEVLLDSEQFIDAFRQADALSRREPAHPGALYAMAAVRMRMGQTQAAFQDLQRLMEASPDHVDGLMALGLVQLRLGATTNAVTSWERGLAAAGGSHEQLERLLAVSRSAIAEKNGDSPFTPTQTDAARPTQSATTTPASSAIPSGWLRAAADDSGQ